MPSGAFSFFQMGTSSLSVSTANRQASNASARCGQLTATATLMYTIFDESFAFLGNTIERSREDFEFAKMFFELTETMFSEGKLETHPEELRDGGLEGVLKGMNEMKENGVSGVKLTYKVA